MPSLFTEDTYEQAIIELFENMGYEHLYAPDFDRDYTSPLLDSVLRDSLVRINRGLPLDAIEEAIAKLKNFDTGSLLQKNIILYFFIIILTPKASYIKIEGKLQGLTDNINKQVCTFLRKYTLVYVYTKSDLFSFYFG